MAIIRLLDQATVNKIAAGEVVERPASVVKEMVENAIDAGATEITVEIQDGGTSLIRITDNGSGIEADQVRTAFLRHATSKIRSVEDLMETLTLGFRGEALASIAAVARVDMVTRTAKQDTGIHYVIEGGMEYVNQEVAAPVGTTIRVENLFFNTPPRKKFLKKPSTEAGVVTDLMQKMILGHPEVSFRYLNGKKEPALFSPGKNNLKNSIFAVYGKEVLDKMIPLEAKVPLSDTENMLVKGYISRPQSMRANRSYETLFINGRYVRSNLLERAMDEAYKDYVVPGTFPIAVLHLEMDPTTLDVNVHPTKMEVRFMQEEKTREGFYNAIYTALKESNLISRVGNFYKETNDILIKGAQPTRDELGSGSGFGYSSTKPMGTSRFGSMQERGNSFDPFAPAKRPSSPWDKKEKNEEQGNRSGYIHSTGMGVMKPAAKLSEEELQQAPKGAKRTEELNFEWKGPAKPQTAAIEEDITLTGEEETPKKLEKASFLKEIQAMQEKEATGSNQVEETPAPVIMPSMTDVYMTQDFATKAPAIATPYAGEQVNSLMPEEKTAPDEPARPKALRLVGQIFRTYWIAEENDVFYIVDQHAAHERVLYDRYRDLLNQGNIDTQSLLEPVVCTVDPKAVSRLDEFMPVLTKLGYEIEAFGEDAVVVRGVPFLFKGPLAPEDMALVIDMCYNGQMDTARDLLIDRIATMSCKAAVKGNDAMSFMEAESLLEQLFASNNPYNCPHGRPTIISVTRYQLEKRFKRV